MAIYLRKAMEMPCRQAMERLWKYKGQKMKYQCGSLKRNSSVPLLSFYFFYFSLFSIFFVFFGWPQWLFLFTSYLSSLGSFDFFLFEIFFSLQGQHSIFYKNIGDLSHFTKVLTKRKCNYHDANVCLCQDSRICNDTSASSSNDSGKAQLACGSSIKQVAWMT